MTQNAESFVCGTSLVSLFLILLGAAAGRCSQAAGLLLQLLLLSLLLPLLLLLHLDVSICLPIT